MMNIREGLRMYRRAQRVKRQGFRRYPGSPEEICRAIVLDCFDGYYRVSAGHFCEFYTRDFALCCDALLSLGHRKEVERTLQYALAVFERAGRVTTTISPDGKPFDFPCPGPDSLAFLLYAIRAAGLPAEKRFLQEQVDLFVQRFMDDGLPRPGRLSSMRDHAKRVRSCYDMTMIALVAECCEDLGLQFPHAAGETSAKLIDTYWNGTYFFSDTQRQAIVTGDANVMPFWTGIVTDRKMRRNAMDAIRAAGLDEPFPLRYVSTTDKRAERVEWHPASWFAPDYETDSIWAHLGLCYLTVLLDVDRKRARAHLSSYERKIGEHGTFLEVYDSTGEPYRTPFYVTDEAMLWCATYLKLSL